MTVSAGQTTISSSRVASPHTGVDCLEHQRATSTISETRSITRLVAAPRSLPPNADLAQHLHQTLLPTGVHIDDVAILAARFVASGEASEPLTTRSTAACGHTPGPRHVDELGTSQS